MKDSALFKIQLEKGKSVALVGVERCGSTPVALALSDILGQKYGLPFLNEFLNADYLGAPLQTGPDGQGGRSRWLHDFGVLPTQGQSEAVAKARWETFCQSQQVVFFKHLVGWLNSVDELQLAKKVQLIFLERANLQQHLFSYLLARTSKIYYQQGGAKYKGPIQAQLGDFESFVRSHEQLQILKSQCHQPQIFIFEELLESQSFLLDGEKVFWNWDKLPPHICQQNPGDKGPLFSNFDKIQAWYTNSVLQKSFPWSSD